MNEKLPVVVLRGGGDLASGVALRLHRIGLNVIIAELPNPIAVRRLVAFAEAVYRGKTTVEDVDAYHVPDLEEAHRVLVTRGIPVLTDPECTLQYVCRFDVCGLVDGRMTKHPPADIHQEGRAWVETVPMIIGLGPGFTAGVNCHAAIETNRGHFLGRVIWDGSPQPDTGIPEAVARHQVDRVLRAPAKGKLVARTQLGAILKEGETIAEVDGHIIRAPFKGILRGLIHDDVKVHQGMKIGDLDPRSDPRIAGLVSEKSLAIGGGVVEALLSDYQLRKKLWT
jgi:xanthine dehydrogenase accessory factor